MKRAHTHCFAAQKGFTLVETIMVMVLLSIAAAAIATLSGNIFNGQTENKDIQVGVQLMQECAEKLLAKGRISYTDTSLNDVNETTPSLCSEITITGYNAPTVQITSGYSGTTGLAACSYTTSGSTNCKLIKITQGNLTNGITFMLVKH